MSSSFETIVPVLEPYRLDLTAAVLRRLSTNVVDRVTASGTYVRAFEGTAGPAILSVAQRSPERLSVTLSGAAGEEARAVALVRRMLGVDRDLRNFEKKVAKVPWLRALAGRMRGLKPPRYPTLWETCVNAIVFQQISLSAAGAIMGRIVRELGTPATFEDIELRTFPAFASFATCGDGALRGFGLSAGKSAALRRVGEALADGSLDEAMLTSRSSAQASELLCRIKGIGPWTASVILLRGLGRLDVFPMNDSGIARSAKAFGEPGVDIDAALETLGEERGMLYYLMLLSRWEARGEISGAEP
jgi:DNA-3-methyladenine glycosylase II